MKRIYTIKYACSCTIGKVRKNNEDNFFCDGVIRINPDSNDDVVLDSVSYDILMNELECLQEQNEFLESICDSTRLLLTKLDKLPKWLQKLIEHFADK